MHCASPEPRHGGFQLLWNHLHITNHSSSDLKPCDPICTRENRNLLSFLFCDEPKVAENWHTWAKCWGAEEFHQLQWKVGYVQVNCTFRVSYSTPLLSKDLLSWKEWRGGNISSLPVFLWHVDEFIRKRSI